MEYVCRANQNIYHVHCFSCSFCQAQITPGDEFYLTSDNQLVCKEDYKKGTKFTITRQYTQICILRSTHKKKKMAMFISGLQPGKESRTNSIRVISPCANIGISEEWSRLLLLCQQTFVYY